MRGYYLTPMGLIAQAADDSKLPADRIYPTPRDALDAGLLEAIRQQAIINERQRKLDIRVKRIKRGLRECRKD